MTSNRNVVNIGDGRKVLTITLKQQKQYGTGSKHASVLLHRFLHAKSQVRGRNRTVSVTQFVDIGDGLFAGSGFDVVDLFARLVSLRDAVSDGATKNNKIQKRVSAQAIGAVYGVASAFASRVQTGYKTSEIKSLAKIYSIY
uniref:Uncharacterized protein n=1 Tax=Romanomermis culicivorax TaxID=13658 RepID=A0A915J6N8_ROMCU